MQVIFDTTSYQIVLKTHFDPCLDDTLLVTYIIQAVRYK